MDLPPIGQPAARLAPDLPASPAEAKARQAAVAFEAAFIAEMLKHSGLNAMPAGFGGGAGEEAFGSLLTDEYARLLAERGGIGIAEQVFELLKQRTRVP
jgi:Rod binding domain-containing protein